MQFSEQWLRSLIDPPLATDELNHLLTMSGLEVESCERVAPLFDNVVVGLVSSVSPHPNADRLRVCQVDVGAGSPLNIVCGAPNVVVGMKAPVALVGAKLPGENAGKPLEIAPVVMRGVESKGMLCSARELGLSQDHSGLLSLAVDAVVGSSVREVLALDDHVILIKLTPNRADCLSVLGIAREATAAAVKLTGAPPAAGEDCPQCGSDTPWGRSNWCPECGYFPKAGFAGTGIVDDEISAPPTLLSVYPEWVAPTLVAVVCILISSIIMRFVLSSPLQRSLVAATQLLVFAATAFAVHSRASFIAMKTGRGWLAFVHPGESWALILSHMPQTKPLIVLLGVGLSGMGSSFVMGLDVDLIAEAIAEEVKDNPKVTFSDILAAMTRMTTKAFGRPNKNAAIAAFGQLTQAMGQMSGESGGDAAGAGLASDDMDGSIGALAGTAGLLTGGEMSGGDGGEAAGGLEGAIGGFGGTASALTGGTSGSGSGGFVNSAGGTASIPQAAGESSAYGKSATPGKTSPSTSLSKGTFDYWIYGYTTNPEGEIRSLLLASTGGTGVLRFSQKLGIEGISSEALAKISEQLKPYRVSTAAVNSPYGGKWVKPVAKCRVNHEGLNADDRPINPKFHKVILP